MTKTGLLLPGGWGLLAALALAWSAAACDQGSPAASGSKDATAGDDAADTRIPATTLGLVCSPGVDPADPRITDFAAADFNGNKGRWSGDENLTLFVYDYHDSGGSDAANKLEAEAFSFSGQVVRGAEESYAGGGMHFDSACVNTTSFAGVQFTLTGTTAGCTVYFDLQTYSQQALFERGGCASYCYHFPRTVVAPSPTPITVLFSDLEGTGVPASAAAMASEIMGMRWQVELAPGPDDAGQSACTFSLTVDDVKFVK